MKLLFRNLLEYDGSVWLATVTAPGDAQLPRDEHGNVVPHAAHEWNRTAAKRWSELHRRAQQATRRELGNGQTLLAYVWQLQQRGVLHLHLVLGFESLEERSIARTYIAHLRRLAPEHGFGFVDARDRDGKKRATVMEPHRAAGYLSRYLGESSQLLEAIALRARPRRVVYVSRRLLIRTGCTMRRLRRVRLLWRIRNGNSNLFALAGRLPAWFRDPLEHAAISALANAP